MAKRIRLSLLWFLLPLALFLLGNWSHSLWDRDEPRYAVATQEMLRTGDFVVPHFNGGIRFDKPVLIYWLMAPAMAVFGENEFGVRFPSALLGAARVLLIFHFALALGCSLRGASVAALVAMLSALLMLISKAATTDSTLVLTVVAALYLWWEQQRLGFAWWRHVLFWVVVGLSILVKGPPGIAVMAFAILGFHLWTALNRWRGISPVMQPPAGVTVPHRREVWSPGTQLLRWGTGIAVTAVVILPWVIATWIRTDGEFFRVAIGVHVIDRTRVAINHHSGPIFYYIPILVMVLLPFTALALNAFAWGVRRRHADVMRFLWSWFVPGFIMFSLVTTKLPHYIAPLIPALALMSGVWWTANERASTAPRQSPWWRHVGAGFVALVGLAAVIALPVAIRLAGFPVSLLPYILTGLLLGGGLLAGAWFWMREEDGRAMLSWSVGFGVGVAVALLWGLPQLDEQRPSRKLAGWVGENAPPTTVLAAVKYQEPSLVFYWADYVEMIGTGERSEGFAMLNRLGEPMAMVITAEEWENYYRARYGGWVDPMVRVVHEQEYFYFEKGGWERMLVIGNWPEDSPSDDTDS